MGYAFLHHIYVFISLLLETKFFFFKIATIYGGFFSTSMQFFKRYIKEEIQGGVES